MVDYDKIPAHIMPGLERYRDHGIPPGDALTAALCNNLKRFVCYADDETLAATRHIVGWIHYKIPFEAQGSMENVEAWKGLEPLAVNA